MTTNAIDRVQKVIACDSRWSMVVDQQHLAFVDNTGFDKLSNREFHTMVFAGDAVLIDQWKSWFQADVLDLTDTPPHQRLEGNQLMTLFVSLVNKEDNSVIFHSGWWLHHREYASFSGSGATHAHDCYVTNGCAKRSIDTAGLNDPATGGDTKFVELSTNVHNLPAAQATLAHAVQQLNERGFVMNTETKVITPIKDFRDSTAEALRALAAGERSLTAPTGLPTKCWSEGQKEAFQNALNDVARREAEARK